MSAKKMDIYYYLIKDHRKVSRLFKQIIATGNTEKRKQLFFQAKDELELHADPEKQTFYQALKKHHLNKDANHGDEEHEEIKAALRKLTKIANSGSVKWLVQFGELKQIVEHHVDDEEEEMFPHAKKVLSKQQAIKLAQAMDQIKKHMITSEKFKKIFKNTKNNIR